MIAVANWVVGIIGIYVGLGVAFAIPFLLKGLHKIDPAAREGTWGFKIAILPGVIAFWPLMGLRWLRNPPKLPTERSPHRRVLR